MNGITVLSLFDGISCGQLALKRAGIKVRKYYASEIKKIAIKVTMEHFPDTVQIGDIEKVRYNRETKELITINEQISNFAQTYPTNLKASSNEALLFMRRYRFANCSCFSCCFKDAYPSSNVQ